MPERKGKGKGRERKGVEWSGKEWSGKEWKGVLEPAFDDDGFFNVSAR